MREMANSHTRAGQRSSIERALVPQRVVFAAEISAGGAPGKICNAQRRDVFITVRGRRYDRAPSNASSSLPR